MVNYLISLYNYKTHQLFTRLKILLFSRNKISFADLDYSKVQKLNVTDILNFLNNSSDKNHDKYVIDELVKGKIVYLGYFLGDLDNFFKNNTFFQSDNLKQYELSYFNFINSLTGLDDSNVLNFVLNKISKIYYESKEIGFSHGFWYPYSVSCRIINMFILLNKIISSDISDKKINEIYKFLFWDYTYLKKNIEFDSDGNHLLKNYISLSVGSFLFERHKFDYYYSKLIKTLDIQILSSGMHYEKTLDYHNSLLFDLTILDICLSSNKCDKNKYKTLGVYISKMTSFSLNFLKNDKVLINDSFKNFHFNDEYFLKTLTSIYNITSIKNTYPFHTLKGETAIEMLVYSSDITPKHCPAHLHDAISTYELWFEEVKFITDSGNYSYNTDVNRSFYRSSFAHNITTTLNGSQSVLLKSFRYGKKAKILSFNQQEDLFKISYLEVKNFFSFQKIKRSIVKESSSITIKDITLKNQSKSYIHLDPGVRIIENKSNYYILEKNNKKLYLSILSPINKVNLIYTGYSDSFYNERNKQTIEIFFDNKLEYKFSHE